VGQKGGHRLITIILSKLNRFKHFFTGNLQLNGYEKCHRALHVATLPCETLMSAKQAINDKLQGSVGTYLRCDGVVNKQTKKCLLLSVSEIFF